MTHVTIKCGSTVKEYLLRPGTTMTIFVGEKNGYIRRFFGRRSLWARIKTQEEHIAAIEAELAETYERLTLAQIDREEADLR